MDILALACKARVQVVHLSEFGGAELVEAIEEGLSLGLILLRVRGQIIKRGIKLAFEVGLCGVAFLFSHEDIVCHNLGLFVDGVR